MKKITRGQTPFNTQNAILAYCLHMAGVPWHNPDRPIRVLYSAEILNKFTNGSGEPIYKGWELEAAVRDAHKKGLRGHNEYVFERVPRLPVLLRAFSDQVDEIENGEGFAHEQVNKATALIGTAGWDVTMMRLACIFLKMRLPFMDKWRDMIPDIIIKNEGRVRRTTNPDGGRTITSAGFKILPLNASKELKEKFGV